MSHAVDTDELCIEPGSRVWLVRVDIHVLDDDGNLGDCASIAAIAALQHFRRPAVSVHDGIVTVHSADERPPVPLTIHHAPICVTFAFFGDGCASSPSHVFSH